MIFGLRSGSDSDIQCRLQQWLVATSEERLRPHFGDPGLKWPFALFLLHDGQLYVRLYNAKTSFGGGYRSLDPKSLVAQTMRKPHSIQRDALLKLANLLYSLNENNHYREFLHVNDVMVGAVLEKAVAYDHSYLIQGDGSIDDRVRLHQQKPVVAEYGWTIDSKYCHLKLDHVDEGTVFWDSSWSVHLSSHGGVTRLDIPDGVNVADLQLLETLPPLDLVRAHLQYQRILDEWPDVPIPHPTSHRIVITVSPPLKKVVLAMEDFGGVARITYHYGDNIVLDEADQDTSLIEADESIWVVKRDLDKEDELERELYDRGLECIERSGLSYWRSSGQVNAYSRFCDPAFWALFLDEHADVLCTLGVEIESAEAPYEIVQADSYHANGHVTRDTVPKLELRVRAHIGTKQASLLDSFQNLYEVYRDDVRGLLDRRSRSLNYNYVDIGDRQLLRLTDLEYHGFCQLFAQVKLSSTYRDHVFSLPLDDLAKVAYLNEMFKLNPSEDGHINWRTGGREKAFVDVMLGRRHAPGNKHPTHLTSPLSSQELKLMRRVAYLEEQGRTIMLSSFMETPFHRFVPALHSIRPSSQPTVVLFKSKQDVSHFVTRLRHTVTGLNITTSLTDYVNDRTCPPDLIVTQYREVREIPNRDLRSTSIERVLLHTNESVSERAATYRSTLESMDVQYIYPFTGESYLFGLTNEEVRGLLYGRKPTFC